MEKKVTLSILTYYDEKLKKWVLDKVNDVNSNIPTALGQLVNDTNFIDNTVKDLVNYYDKNTIDKKLAEGGIGIKIVQVDRLPEAGEANTIYLANAEHPAEKHKYNKYLYVDNAWEEFGESVDLSSYVTETTMNAALDKKVDKEEGKQLSQENFTTALKDKLDSLENADLTNYYNKQEVDAKIPDTSSFITKATAALENYYLKTETYSQEEINRKISAIETLSFEVVSALPDHDIKTNKIYLLSLEKQGEQNKYGEYIYVEETWEQIGTLTSDLDLDSLKAEVALKANAADVYSKTDADQTFAKTEDIPSTLPNPHTLTLKFNGEDFVTYDGSADVDKDIVIDVAEIPGLDEEIERLIAAHGTTEGFKPFDNGAAVWESEAGAYKISGSNQTVRFTNEERETITNGGYMFITADEIYKYYILLKNNQENFVIEYGRVNSDGSEGSHQVFSTQTLIDLTQVVDSTTLQII